MPLPYWSGAVTIARLGSHGADVFVAIFDVGRQVLIEARDSERGPALASSKIPFEAWTGLDQPPQRYFNRYI